MNAKEHWENIYSTKAETEVSWFQERPDLSLKFLKSVAPTRDARIIDIGGGASTLVDHLLKDGFFGVTVLDLSGEALAASRKRLRSAAEGVVWIEGDVTLADLGEGTFDVWHDRAVFHFLTDPDQRRRYIDKLTRALPIGKYAIIATFGLDGPERCSGLPVMRYTSEMLATELRNSFRLVSDAKETHVTPFGTDQRFVYALFERI